VVSRVLELSDASMKCLNLTTSILLKIVVKLHYSKYEMVKLFIVPHVQGTMNL
jgi:hypothetical protein